MPPRKPTYDWKARACEEFRLFTVPFAIKEYVQNVVGQALKDLRQREFSEWKREDLRGVSANEQDQRKKSLISEYPGLLTGPHGAAVKNAKNWLPFYILSATIPRSRLQVMAATDLKIALVVWRHEIAKITALSVFNNHLDARATFSSFTVDGASTSRHNKWAVGEKGKGFILATQFLFEHVENTISQMSDPGLPRGVKAAVSFRVGHQIGTLKWKKSRLYEDELLQVVLDDLTPHTVEHYIEKLAADARQKAARRKAADARRKTMDFSDKDDDDSESNDQDDDDSKSNDNEPSKLREQAEHALEGVHGTNKARVLHNHGRCLVASDEVAITVIGLDGSFQPEYLFSAIYGIIPPAQAWRVPGSQVQFFIAAAEDTVRNSKKSSAKFYHRDQYVPHGLHLHRLSINYHGDLNITSDRVAILRDDNVINYKLAVSRSADIAFRTIRDLALELALDILSDEHSEGLAHLVRPHDKLGADAYRKAFEAAIRKKHPEIAAEAHIHPTNAEFISPLFAELGLTPVKVSSKAWEIMEASGAYVSLDNYARRVLLSSPPIDQDSHDLHRLRVAMSVIAKDVPSANVTIRDYDKSTPTVAWDKNSNTFAFALPPKCDDHPTSRCLCWVGPFLQDAAKDYAKDPEQARLSAKKLFSAYLACMNSKASVEDPNGMDVDPSQPASKTQGDRTSSKSSDSRAKTRSQPAPTSGRRPRQPNRPPRQAASQAATTTATTSNSSVSQTPSESSSVERARTQPAGVLAVDEDAPLAAFTNLVAALDEAHSMATPLLDKFNSLMSTQEELSTQVDVLKIESATCQVRIEELDRLVAQKDALVSSFQDKIRALEERNEKDALEVEEFLRSRKRART
ncbi:hypothetical protein GGX14DRAFT_441518 [Mycena pura]|uniref:Uncharacterized protein n=1 Tax=Mycena pura TaxID=153505 RepID=A0AAD6VLB3_9AGAR|nr:hypothetical protein GGX14DRAFT_441518 [Mycena pura]